MKLYFFLKRQYAKFIAIPLAQHKLKHIKILSSNDSIRYIIRYKCSVSRYGDGEFNIMMGNDGNTFQTANSQLAEKLKQVIVAADAPNHYIGIPVSLKDTTRLRKSSRDFWGFFTLEHVNELLPFFSPERTYLDTQLSRFYITYQGGNEKRNKINRLKSAEQLALLKKIWDGQDIVIVEGCQSRTGVGNDLYDNAKSIQRILGLATNAFEKYDEMLEAVTKNVSKDRLILLSYGMCATVLAYDLAKLGYWAIDIGHLDTEYEWMKMRVTENIPIKGKFTNEAGVEGRENVDVCQGADYLNQIICDITKP